MRARERDDVPPGAGAEHGLREGLVGTGDALGPAPRSVDDAVEAMARVHGDKAARMLRRFADLPAGTFVWTRDTDGLFHLGRVAGAWRYDDSGEAHEVGIHHVRACSWLERPFGEPEVPPAVAHTFARGGRNLQRIRDAAAERGTEELWPADASD